MDEYHKRRVKEARYKRPFDTMSFTKVQNQAKLIFVEWRNYWAAVQGGSLVAGCLSEFSL